MTGGPAATFDCLWCGRSWQPRSPEDLEGWARLCPDCLGKAGDNPFLRLRLREALAARAAAASAAGPASRPAPTPATLVLPAQLARPRGPVAVPPATLDDWYLRRGGFARGPLHDVAWQANLDAAGRWLDGLSLGHVIVELGDGAGWWAPLLAAMGELWCFDSDPAALERTRERLLAHRLRAHLHLRDPWSEPDLQADALFAAFRLGRLPAPDRPAFLELARRWLRPGGTLAVVELAVEAGSGLRASKVGGSDVGASDLAGSDAAGSDLRHATPQVDASSSPAVAGLPVALANSDLRAALRQAGFGAVEVARPGRWLLLGRATA